MSRAGSSGWLELRPEHLLAIDGEDFQEFCHDLVKYEAYERHDDPEITGSAGRSVPDGGRDLVVSVSRPAVAARLAFQRRYRLAPLTEDLVTGQPRTRIAYSCKSGKNWLDTALEEARYRSERPVEILSEGGYFKLLINGPGMLDAPSRKTKKTPHERLRDAYWARLRELDPDTPDPGPRIKVYDADKLITFVRELQPGGAVERWLDRFELVPILRGLEEWRELHMVDRDSPPEIVYDDERQQLAEELLGFVRGAERRVALLVGKPGVGKTRLVLESLSADQTLSQRVRVALSPEEAADAIDTKRLLRRHRDVVLVVDDCLPSEARSLRTKFLSAAGSDSRARLIALIPAALDAVSDALPRADVWSLEPFDHEHAQKVVANEIGRPVHDGAASRWGLRRSRH